MKNYNILIPTYNRPECLKRILGYYDNFGEQFKIIIADSSSNEKKKINKKIVTSLSNVDINYLDHYSSSIVSHHKFADMVNYAEKKYCVFCGDDDFIIPNGIKQSINFLEINPDFSCVHGQYFAFDVIKQKKDNFVHWIPIYSGQSIISSDANERLSGHFTSYDLPTIYGVHQTDFYKMIYQIFLSSAVDPILFGELLPSMLTLIYGNMKKLDVAYAARQSHLTVKNASGYWMGLNDYIEQGKYTSEYEKFKNCLSYHLSSNSHLDIDYSNGVIDDAMNCYLKRSYPQLFGVRSVKNLNDFVKLPLRYLSSLQKMKLVKYYELMNIFYKNDDRCKSKIPPGFKIPPEFKDIEQYLIN